MNEATGRPCCYTINASGQMAPPDHPCAKCARHFAGDAPDPYAEGIRRLRAASGEPPTPEMVYDAGGVPDPYFHGIQALRALRALRGQEAK
jgi:hypothetical protein